MQILNNAESIESSTIRQLLAYWRSKSRDGGIPARADIDPAEIVTILPNLMIVDFERDPFRVQFRLVGTRVVEVTGFEFTGMYLDEIAMPDVEESFLECYEAACRTRQPMFERITWRFDDQTTGEDLEGSLGILGLGGEGCAFLDAQTGVTAQGDVAA